MRRYAEALSQFIMGRTDAYAVQQADGSYIVTSDGKTRCGVYDFDEKTESLVYYRVTRTGYADPQASSLTPSPPSTNTPGKVRSAKAKRLV
jgi:hypothetical protein